MSAIPTTAQAWRFPPDQKSWNGHKSLELRQVKITAPKQGEVLVKLHAAALNYRYFARNGQLASFLIELTLAGTFSLARDNILAHYLPAPTDRG
ncbi:hypothetical protein RHS03_07724, partial [Rhizoctonia solani]